MQPSLSSSLRMSVSVGDLHTQLAALRLELADVKCRNEELERHLHLSKNEVGFLRSEVMADSTATREQQLVLLRSHSGSSRDVGRSLAMEQECAMLRSLLEEAQCKLHLANKECAYLKGELEGVDGGCNERLVVWKDVRGAAPSTKTPAAPPQETTAKKPTIPTKAPTVEFGSNTENAHVDWERELRETRAQLEVLQCQRPPPSSSCGTQVLRCRTANISTQTAFPPPLEKVKSLGVEDPQEVAPPPYSPKRTIPVHDPSDPKHRAECLWCSGRTIQLGGGTFGVSSPRSSGSWRRSASSERGPNASRERSVSPKMRSPRTSFREAPRMVEDDASSPSRLRSALLLRGHI